MRERKRESERKRERERERERARERERERDSLAAPPTLLASTASSEVSERYEH